MITNFLKDMKTQNTPQKIEYIPKVGELVRVVSSVAGTSWKDGLAGVVTSINNIGEIWVDFPDGSGGLATKVKPYSG